MFRESFVDFMLLVNSLKVSNIVSECYYKYLLEDVDSNSEMKK